MATHRKKVYNYIGMIFDFSAKGKVMVTMMEYIKSSSRTFQRKQSQEQKCPLLWTIC